LVDDPLDCSSRDSRPRRQQARFHPAPERAERGGLIAAPADDRRRIPALAVDRPDVADNLPIAPSTTGLRMPVTDRPGALGKPDQICNSTAPIDWFTVGGNVMAMRQNLLGVFAAVALTVSAPSLHAESWPQRAVRIIVPVSAGVGTDVAARLFAERLAERWKQPAIIENRPGADGLIGTAAFANMRDDHALLYWNSAVFTLYPLLQEKLPYDPRRDIVPISFATNNSFAVTASNHLNTSSLRAVVDAARSRPGSAWVISLLACPAPC
jgi:hypothetical protein